MSVAVLGTGRMGAYRARWLGSRPEVEAVLVGSRDQLSYRGFCDRSLATGEPVAVDGVA